MSTFINNGIERMKQLAARDLNAVLTVGRTALECDNLQDLQDQTFRLMEDCVGASSGVYLGISGSDQQWSFEGGSVYGVPNNGLEVWCTDYQNQDPFVSRFLQYQTPDDHVVISSEVISHKQFIRTRFYREFLKPQSVYHIMILGLVKDGQPIGLFGFHRAAGTPAFSESDATKANLLSPFLSAAVQKIDASNKTNEREHIIRVLAADRHYTGVIILDAGCAPISTFGNVTGILPTRANKLSSALSVDIPIEILGRCDNLKRMLGSSYQDEYYENFNVELASGHTITVHLHPYGCGASGLRFLVFFGARQSNGIYPELLDQYKLTPRQVDITNLVSLGLTNLQIADNLCISGRTVQNHLRSIYAKVKVHNRTSLISKMVRQH